MGRVNRLLWHGWYWMNLHFNFLLRERPPGTDQNNNYGDWHDVCSETSSPYNHSQISSAYNTYSPCTAKVFTVFAAGRVFTNMNRIWLRGLAQETTPRGTQAQVWLRTLQLSSCAGTGSWGGMCTAESELPDPSNPQKYPSSISFLTLRPKFYFLFYGILTSCCKNGLRLHAIYRLLHRPFSCHRKWHTSAKIHLFSRSIMFVLQISTID